jgi:hypothetical protein
VGAPSEEPGVADRQRVHAAGISTAFWLGFGNLHASVGGRETNGASPAAGLLRVRREMQFRHVAKRHRAGEIPGCDVGAWSLAAEISKAVWARPQNQESPIGSASTPPAIPQPSGFCLGIGQARHLPDGPTSIRPLRQSIPKERDVAEFCVGNLHHGWDWASQIQLSV